MAQGTGLSSWWGRHATASDRTDFWQIGPLRLWVHSLPYQLNLKWSTGQDFLDGHLRGVPGAHDSNGALIESPQEAESVTCAHSGNTRGEIVLSPVLPDRAVVVRMNEGIAVLPGDEVTFYMLVPLWLRVDLAEGTKLLHEIPSYRMSDTWFGPMSNLGSLCYASSSELYLNLQTVPVRPHCVITAITIKNLGSDSLKLERLNIPFPRLSLFYSQNTGFWTDRLVLERREDREMANLQLDRQPPSAAGATQFVTGPRQSETDASPVIRAFSAIFRERGQS